MRAIPLLVVLIVLFASVPASVGAQTEGEPVLDAAIGDNRLVPGEERSLQITLTNAGKLEERSPRNSQENQRVTTARALNVTTDDEDIPLNVRTGRQVVGSLPDGGSERLSVAVSVDEDADPGTYELPVTVNYTYTSEITATSEETETVDETFNISVVIEDDARLSVVDVDPSVRIGSTDTVAVTVENTGTAVARDATLTAQSRTADLTFGGSSTASRHLGAFEAGESRTVQYQGTVAAGAAVQPYAVDLTLAYEDERGQPATSRSRTAAITPREQQTFSVKDVNTTVAVDDDGTVTLKMRNDGPIAVSDATVRLASTSPDLRFAGSSSASRFLGVWGRGEDRTLRYDLTATDGAETREYAMDATVTYRDQDGDTETAPTRSIGVRPAPEQSFDIGDVSSTLAVGDEGTLRGTVTNTGDRDVRNAVVVFETSRETVTPIEREFAVGDLAAGESGSFSIPLEISESAESGPQQYSLSVQYRTREGERRTSDTVDVRQPVGPDVPEFELTVDGGTVEAGSGTQLEVTVTNTGNQSLTDVSATLFADAPISVTDDEAFITELEPGESETVPFGVAAGTAAVPKKYPLSLDFQYDDADGDTLLSDTYRVALTVEASEDEGLPLVPIAILVIVLLGVVAILYRLYY